MQQVTPFLWFESQAEEAARFYTSIIPGSRIIRIDRAGPESSASGVEFELAGARYIGFNGGPTFSLNEAFSIVISCDTQEEIDRYWSLLTEGGEESRCGWLKDRFGLWWQVVPAELLSLLGDPDPERARRAQEAMLSMVKLDIAALRAARDGA